jgi:hypothetical protein
MHVPWRARNLADVVQAVPVVQVAHVEFRVGLAHTGK